MPQYVHTNNSSFAIPYNGSWAHLSYFLNAGHTTRKWVRDGGFDILHLHEPETPSLSHKPLVMHDAPPMVATFHASIEPYPRALRLFTRYLRNYLSPLREAIFVSESAQKTAEHYLPQQVGIQTIPNGIECDFYRRAEPNPQWQGSPEAPTIGFPAVWVRRAKDSRCSLRPRRLCMRHSRAHGSSSQATGRRTAKNTRRHWRRQGSAEMLRILGTCKRCGQSPVLPLVEHVRGPTNRRRELRHRVG